MLQRAASNAYSWWWASHIRTKQSKWLEQSLQDMEDKVQSMLKMIEEDGDSFAKRAEMYYKRRPELISSVEEAYKVFRALADRYDLLSKDLQNANNKIATVFPDEVLYDTMDEDDESPTPKMPKNPQIPMGNIPKVPKAPTKDLKSLITKASKQFKSDKSSNKVKNQVLVEKSGLTKKQALEEIDNLQKNILALQTVKEFVKSSYESGLEKYWGIENQIMEMQQKVCRLKDEFTVDRVIEDDEARTLMAEAALKSCQETLTQLQEKQERTTLETREEYKKIEAARERLNSFKHEYLKSQISEENPIDKEGEDKIKDNETVELMKEAKEIEIQDEKPKGNMELSPTSSLTVAQLAERIDELVTKVIGLGTAVSSQTVLITTLRTEADDLHNQIRTLEDEKETLMDDTHDLSTRVKEMEDKLNKIQDLNKNVERQNSKLQTNFDEACSSLGQLSLKLSSAKPDEEVDEVESSEKKIEDVSIQESKMEEVEVHVKEVEVDVQSSEASREAERQETKPMVQDSNTSERVGGGEEEKEEELNWQQMLLSGTEDKEKILLKEYTTVLRNYKDLKKKLNEMEKKERDTQFDITLEMRTLKKAILKRDEEIHTLRRKLGNDQDSDVGDRGEKPEEAGFEEDDDEIKLVFINQTPLISVVEEKLRMDIDAILDENLDFWLRFSSSFHQVQKFKNEVQDLNDEISKLKEKKMKQETCDVTQIKSEVRPIYNHLREIQNELTVWLEHSSNLKDELKRRFESLCSLQEEITKALKEGVEEDEIRFSSHQAAKFQGEILNMKQENNKVREELQAGWDHVSLLQIEIDKTLKKLNEEFGISNDQTTNTNIRTRIPLRSFIFGTKPKKQKHSIFSCMHPNRRFGVSRGHAQVSASSNHQ